MSRLVNSWRLIRASATAVFPLVAGVAALPVTLAFAAPPWLTGAFGRFADARQSSAVGLAILFLFYLAQSAVITGGNAALIGAALLRRTWAEQLMGTAGVGAVAGLGALVTAAPLALLLRLAFAAGSAGATATAPPSPTTAPSTPTAAPPPAATPPPGGFVGAPAEDPRCPARRASSARRAGGRPPRATPTGGPPSDEGGGEEP